MGVACPGCGESSQVLRLAEFWLSLSQDAELKRVLAQPPSYAGVWWIPVGAVVLAVLGFSSGAAGLGVGAAVCGLLAVVWMVSQWSAAERARAAWAVALYCRRCPLRFPPHAAFEKA